MLQRITIHNLALIKHLEIEFNSQLNVFSGETGAGKSIIVDSLMLLVGGRYDKSLLKFGEDSGYVEGVFDFNDSTPLESMGVDCEDGIFIVTRKFTKDGKNDIRVNGKQMTTAMLRELMQNYVDIYGQNEYQSLLKISEQKKILDYFVFKTDGKPLERQKHLYDEYKKLCTEMESLGDETARAQRIDVLNYQIDEIVKADVKPDEEQQLLDRRHVLMAAERIKNALAECYAALDDGDCSVTENMDGAMRAMSGIASFGEKFSELESRLKSVSIELDDIAECVRDELNGMDGSEQELDEVSSRLDKIRALKSKYGAYESMQKFLTEAKAEAERLSRGADLYNELCKKESVAKKALYDNSKLLSDMRRKGAVDLQKRIVSELGDLGMAKSSFEVVFAEMPNYDEFATHVTSSGFDSLQFYLSPNVGQPLLPLIKIISGGEMSRFMLAIKLVTGDLSSIGTMIFDEVDTGISGAIGLCVAKKLAQLSRGHQVLCVTHLAQIAAMADGHYFIEKSEKNGDTQTSVTPLDRSGMIGEISRLSGTKGVSSSSDKSATELKDFCDTFKSGTFD
ncbi:MAG: DNA repair protein RecN [Clostridiales bacterium]|nr:DNA repair protein RecN [Clostridiales bacterium]